MLLLAYLWHYVSTDLVEKCVCFRTIDLDLAERCQIDLKAAGLPRTGDIRMAIDKTGSEAVE